MKKLLILLTITFVLSYCAKKEISRPVLSGPNIAHTKTLANISSIQVPRILKIDQRVKIIVNGFFDQAGYTVSKVNIKRNDNEIRIKLFGVHKNLNTTNKKFKKVIILPPQREGEYDVVIHGKNKTLNEILWVEQYRGADRVRYLQRLRQRNQQG